MKTELKGIVILSIVVGVVLAGLFQIGFLSNVETELESNLYGGRAALDSIVIVAIDDKSIQEIGRWPWSREVWIETLPKLNESKVIGIDVGFFETETEEIDEELGRVLGELNVVVPVEYLFEEKTILKPIPQIKSTRGYINVITDRDGKTRAFNPNIEGEYKSFAEEVYKKYWDAPIEMKNRELINYVGPAGSYKTYSFSDVEKGDFKDKIVLIGATAPNLHDEVHAPGSARPMPGVEVHANIIQMMITKKFITKENNWWTVLRIILISIIIGLLFYYLPIWASILSTIGLMIINLLLTIWLFGQGTIINIIYVPIVSVVSYTSTALYHYIHEKRHRKQIVGAFEKYVSKDVIKHIMEHPDRLKLGGEKREITVFFSDIRGFTSISEKLKPEELVHLLNEYLTEMTEIILKHNGVVDKYMGDAIMAFWGAPLEQPKHAERACQASLDMEKRLKELQNKWNKEGIPALEIGIGMNTGYAVVGNMGSENRFDYTAMGDTINLGSRLEGINKQYGTRIIISETTKKKLGKEFITRKLDAVKVKGKKEPVVIYELIGERKEGIEEYEKGLGLYFKQKWDEAVKEFKKCGDTASNMFIERCEYFKENPPGKKWDGAWVMKTK